MGFRPTADELAILIEEIDEDGSGAIEFGEFAQLCAKFLVEVDNFIFYISDEAQHITRIYIISIQFFDSFQRLTSGC